MSYRRQLDTHVTSRALSETGKEWFVTALDPFHDYEHALAGYPDADGSNTTVSCYQYTATINNPDPGNNWDCHVFNSPLAQRTTASVYRHDGSQYRAISDLPFPIGFLNVYVGSQSSTLTPTGTDIPQGALVLPPVGVSDLASSTGRVIAAGFEIVNTTAELYKQGTITAYMQPNASSHAETTAVMKKRNGTDDAQVSVAGPMFSVPPKSEAKALLLRGSRQWPAAEGAYVPLRFNSVHNPLTTPAPSSMLMCDAGEGRPDVWIMADVPATDGPSMDYEYRKFTPMNTSGVFLTGLHTSTTLTIKLRVFVEKAPGVANPELAVLANPSAPYDVAALTLYSQVCAELPIAVDVNQNAAGDWFRSVLRAVTTAGQLAAPLLSVANPAAGAALGAVSTVAGSSFKGNARPARILPSKPRRPVVRDQQKNEQEPPRKPRRARGKNAPKSD